MFLELVHNELYLISHKPKLFCFDSFRDISVHINFLKFLDGLWVLEWALQHTYCFQEIYPETRSQAFVQVGTCTSCLSTSHNF